MDRARPQICFRPTCPRAVAGSAFSLIELLLVLAIVAILASLYLRATTGSGQGRVLQNCQNHQQRIFIALEIYAADHQGGFPERAGARRASDALDGLVPRYTADTASFICPGSSLSPPPSGESIASRKISYAYYMGRKKSAATEALLSDEQVDASSKLAGQMVFSTTGAPPANNHQKAGGNFLFTDGHVEQTPPRVPFSLVLTQGVVLLNP